MVVTFRLILDAGHSRDNADNGWKYVEGEHEGRNGAAIYFGVSYRWSRCSLSLFMQHPFQQHPVIQRGKVLNENLYKTIQLS